MGKILPILLAVLGIGAGIGAGILTKPAPVEAEVVETEEVEEEPPAPDSTFEYAELSNQFVIPLVSDGTVRALVVLSLTIEVTTGTSETVFQREPKLRDAFLQVLFDHANIGGFDGYFTGSTSLSPLRKALQETAADLLGKKNVNDVLVTDLVRQEV